MLTDSRMVTNGTTNRAEPRSVQIFPKLRVSFPFWMENGGSWKGGSPPVTLPFQNYYLLVYQIRFFKKSFICTSQVERIVDWFSNGAANKTTDDGGYDDDNCITRCGNKPKTSIEESLERGRILFITQLKPIEYLKTERFSFKVFLTIKTLKDWLVGEEEE